MSDSPGREGHVNIADLIASADEFYRVYGRALSEWNRVEEALCTWFVHITGMPEAMCRQIFFSAKSFAGRTDMLKASIDASSLSDLNRVSIQEAVRKSDLYSGFRNRIAHRQTRYDIGPSSRSFREYVLVEGKIPSTSAEFDATTIAHLKTAAQNFDHLGTLIFNAHPWYQELIAPSPKACLLPILELPNQADSTEPAQIQPTKLQQLEQLLGSPLT